MQNDHYGSHHTLKLSIQYLVKYQFSKIAPTESIAPADQLSVHAPKRMFVHDDDDDDDADAAADTDLYKQLGSRYQRWLTTVFTDHRQTILVTLLTI